MTPPELKTWDLWQRTEMQHRLLRKGEMTILRSAAARSDPCNNIGTHLQLHHFRPAHAFNISYHTTRDLHTTECWKFLSILCACVSRVQEPLSIVQIRRTFCAEALASAVCSAAVQLHFRSGAHGRQSLVVRALLCRCPSLCFAVGHSPHCRNGSMRTIFTVLPLSCYD